MTATPNQDREADEIADELDAMSERITRYSNSPGDLLCTLAAALIRRQAAALAAQPQAAPQPEACDWHEDDDGLWQMACGGDPWLFEDGGVVENRVKHCMHCGKPVRNLSAAPHPTGGKQT